MKCPAEKPGEISFRFETSRTESRAKIEFRQRFKRSLSQCAKRGFSIEECFGLIWEEISEKVRLPEPLQSQLYEELIAWAKKRGA